MEKRGKSDTSNDQFHLAVEDEQPTDIEPTKHRRIRKMRRVRRPPKLDLDPAKILLIPGVEKVIFSYTTQKYFKCVVGEDVTAEYPWKRLPKEDLIDNLENYEAESDFFPIKDQILAYACQEFLAGYIPSENQDYEEFYICVSALAEDAVTQIIENILGQREERLNNSILKTVGPWKPQGSQKEVELQIYKNNRSLLEVEFEAQYPVSDVKYRFKFRFAEHAQDGYVELLSKRTTFSNLSRKRIDTSAQVTPTTVSNVAQTILGYPKNISTQYEYEYQSINHFSKEFTNNVKSFVENRMNEIDDFINVNSHINFYKDDYSSLVTDIRTTFNSGETLLKECFSLYDQNLGMGKVIASLSWHPMWSGVLAIAYTRDGSNLYRRFKPNEDEVVTALFDINPVQLWSFTDSLTAKLYLETPRQVTSLSFCPSDENILVGGCINGQVVVWDLKDRLQKVENEEILTPAQQRYRTRMQSLMKWMKDTKDLKMVRTTVASDLEYSHTSAITAIRWISPNREISRSGKISDIPDDFERTSQQFMTASKDGTVLIWDLLVRPITREGIYKARKKLRRLKRCPSALVTDVSHLKDLNRILKPIFKVNVLAPNTSRPLPITALHARTTSIRYEEINPMPNRKYNITDRIYHKAVVTKPVHPLVNQFLAGTAEGDFLCASWDGYEFNAGEVVNKETCKIQNFAKYHDGPIVALSRSAVFPDLILTVGGKIFALWKIGFMGRPVLWRKCKQSRYTYGVWNIFRPSLFRLLRDDGCVELWQLKMRSDRYQYISFVSGGSLTGTYTNALSKDLIILAIADYTSALRLFVPAGSLSAEDEQDKSSTYRLLTKEVDRKLKFFKWQDDWKRKNAKMIAGRRERELARKEKEEEDKKEHTTQTEMDTHVTDVAKLEADSFAKAAQNQWILKEQKRMNAVLLHKKMLDFNLLEKQQVPLKKIAEEQQNLEKKISRRQNNGQKIFYEAVATLFPDAIEKKPQPPPDPYGGGDCLDVKVSHFKKYQELEGKCEKIVSECKHIFHFNWFFMRREGKKRRRLIDGYYTRDNHRDRLIREKQEAERIAYETRSYRKPPSKPPSLESIDYSDLEDQTENEEPEAVSDVEE